MTRVEKWLLGAAIMAIAVVFVMFHFRLAQSGLGLDFDVYYRAARRFMASNYLDIYNYQLDGVCPFRYPPISLPLFLPFAFVPLWLARYYWFYAQLISIGLGYYFVYRSLRVLSERALFYSLLIFFLSFRFAIDAFAIGQVSPMIFALLSGALCFYLNGRPIPFGGFFVFANGSQSWVCTALLFFNEHHPHRITTVAGDLFDDTGWVNHGDRVGRFAI